MTRAQRHALDERRVADAISASRWIPKAPRVHVAVDPSERTLRSAKREQALEEDMATIEMGWGLIKTVENASAAWGARAIYRNHCVDVVRDRQQIAGDEPAKRALAQWLMKKTGGGMTLLSKRLKTDGVLPSEDREIAIDHGRFHLRANPRASYGHLYITAWMDEPAASEVSR